MTAQATTTRPRVCVLLSTYNGSRFLDRLLQSLSNQEDVDVILHTRDDGSSDNTVQILDEFKNLIHSTQIINEGPRMGPAASFLSLLETAPADCAYYAFCDQDDTWEPGKLYHAVAALTKIHSSKPSLYCSRVSYTNSQGEPTRLSRSPMKPLGFPNALVECPAPGCTMVMNQTARNLLTSRLPVHCNMHDWWCYLVVSAFGHVIYDPAPHINVRLHDANTSYPGISFVGLLRQRIRRLVKYGHETYTPRSQAKAFARLYGNNLDETNNAVLSRFISPGAHLLERIGYSLHPDVYRQNPVDNLLLRILILTNLY